jgi:MoaA/NifB/PqqE/SkfB family radical SAM enzyme
MIKPEQIDFIEFNVTNLCNSRCPACPRTHMLDQLDLTSMSPELFETIAQGLGEHAKNICASFCGTTGDAVSHPNIEQIIDIGLQYYRDVFMETNGGARTPEFYRRLANKNKLKIRFSIDGLADTNALYRINTDFDRIIANAQAFIDDGGKAEWKYIIFDHNQHQVEQARELSKKMGFTQFSTVVSNRFLKLDSTINVDSKKYSPKINKVDQEIKQQGFTIKPAEASDPTIREQHTKTWQTLDQDQSVSIDCRTTKEGYLFVDQWGKLWPCCFWATEEETHVQHNSLGKNRWKDWRSLFHKMYDSEFNQLSKNNTVVDMLNHPLFVSWLPDSFAGKHNKCTVCLSRCTANKTTANILNYS